jgi:hypothetical protein
VTHALGNSAPFTVYCSAFHPHRNLWRKQWVPNGIDQQWLRGLHSWMEASSRELESKYTTYVQSIGIRCDDVGPTP